MAPIVSPATDRDPPPHNSPPPLRPSEQPSLELTLRPAWIGINDTEITVDFQLGIANPSTEPVTDIRIRTFLLTAHRDQDAEIARLLGQLESDAALPSLELAAGQRSIVDARMSLPREGVQVAQLAGRACFVPLLVADVRYAMPGGSEARITASFVLGRRRQDTELLAPIFLDRGLATYRDVDARNLEV